MPSSLVRTTPSTSTASEKTLAWRRPFWPVVASIEISVSCGASGICFCDHPADLGQLLHQVALGVEAAGGVDDDDVGAAGAGGVDRVVGDRAGVGALFAADQLGAGALGPRFELLGGGGAVGVGGGEDDARGPSPCSGARRSCRSSSSCRCR